MLKLRHFRGLITLSLMVFLSAGISSAQTFKSIYSFQNGSDGAYPQDGVTLSKGELYGATDQSVLSIYTGDVFSVNPKNGQESTLFYFSNLGEGVAPYYVTPTNSGTIVGTADGGGDVSCIYGSPQSYGCGDAWSYNRALNSFTVLYSFDAFPSGFSPAGPLLSAKNGLLYGTTVGGGGSVGGGTVFSLNPSNSSLTTLHSFAQSEGIYPTGPLLMDSKENIYGENIYGGNCPTCGTVYMLSRSGKLTVLHAFSGSDGSFPDGGLTFGPNNVLYGVTAHDGAGGYGTIFELNIANKALTTLYSFSGGADGAGPEGGVVSDTTGVLYGTTVQGGSAKCALNGTSSGGCGTIFKFVPVSKTFTTLHIFSGKDGMEPDAALAFDGKSTFYGSTVEGGKSGFGTVFKLQE